MKPSTWISGLTITALCMGCSSVEQADQNSAQTTHRDTVLIDADRLEQGRLFEPVRNPFTRDDAAKLVGADRFRTKPIRWLLPKTLTSCWSAGCMPTKPLAG
ncbi:hypothetical protein DYU11_26905 [Fibrisoma montanum]|uniref:Uncharacterized protein n=1 Tax=Fibrisoma montanum TaxID=2305895 RepID=A0A418M0F4_9BACT|nr:hypothetical protein [Fibrisoma montanum]RIV19120.1 hypothetical protein DYU11_26905 [Fibrisoma montanum]